MRWIFPTVLLGLLLAFPPIAAAMGLEFYQGLLTKIMIFALAASSLNLILGYGGMVSFGHAAYFGLGAYTVAILMREGVTSGWVIWAVAVGLSALLALLIGAISLRTRGIYFIMITLAFAQMIYYLVVSFKQYGGEDGLRARRPEFGLFELNDTTLYYLTLGVLLAALYLLYRLVHSRFGRVLQAIRENEARALALGYPVFHFQLVAFVLAGALAGLAGVLMAHYTQYASPNLLAWQQSGHLMMMVILGGVGQFWGGVLGALVLSLVEEILQDLTIHWQLGVGLILLFIVLFAPKGLAGLMRRGS
ncbi:MULTISPECIES: branched-chain amino acid ABC transporter permease [Meiothermus]|jgi:branched-chain amino acid transport system permease protein|uniref:Inner-membrane translocator n=2 Tax=Meiothermus ruber TaxID=277 RepID=D3PTU3_MEIRD|nr:MULTISPECIES: branched-chain amino acid ABC transporter permease [Meiothermus]ADD28876.1 inner-membrane translocator [Meiothermus ruber DSM 1279]AGK05675.1 inner-membrane translocator [Meiothermus ruber DSM 1279]MCL6530850.1 branched-chain amino acid ABC transporter permease [Meiothermus ruber]GAO75791.1 inner-membrane translocator [Meiothermus ruber H328]GIW27445.1 MAG: branched-chain amino acid ABC transporter permease [Meiothermus sp.]